MDGCNAITPSHTHKLKLQADAFLRAHNEAARLVAIKARLGSSRRVNITWLENLVIVEDGQRIFRTLMPDDEKPNGFFTVDLPIPDDASPLEFLLAVMRHK